MIRTKSPRAVEARYEKAAQDYLQSLPLEHFMESTPHATQRKITLESLDLLQACRSDVHVFNELLVQYRMPRRTRLGQVVPDNMVVVHAERIKAGLSYNVPLQPAGPFWVLDYVSKNTKRKDYVDNKRRYERELKVPYYLLFDPEEQKVTLDHLEDKSYVSVKPNAAGRLILPELHLEMGLVDGWVRFWHQGELLPLPAELQGELAATKGELAESKRELAEMASRAEAAEREAAALRKQIEALRLKKNGL